MSPLLTWREGFVSNGVCSSEFPLLVCCKEKAQADLSNRIPTGRKVFFSFHGLQEVGALSLSRAQGPTIWGASASLWTRHPGGYGGGMDCAPVSFTAWVCDPRPSGVATITKPLSLPFLHPFPQIWSNIRADFQPPGIFTFLINLFTYVSIHSLHTGQKKVPISALPPRAIPGTKGLVLNPCPEMS